MSQAPLLTRMLVLLVMSASPAAAEVLVADTSRRHVAITTGFTGTDVLLFGAVEGAGDIVVVIRGPAETVVVRRKQRIAGVWANTDSVVFQDAPNFHQLATSRPLEEIADPGTLRQLNIGADNLEFTPAPRDRHRSSLEIEEFRKALVRNKRTDGLYDTEPAPVLIMSERLFRTPVHFPANMATGNYTATIYLFRDGAAVQLIEKPIVVQKSGFGAEVYTWAHNRAPLYGAAAIVVAIAAGWLAGFIFRNV